MKKLFFLAAAITVMASCADEKFLGEDPGTLSENATDGAIAFGFDMQKTTRADIGGSAAATILGSNFYVTGTKGTEATTSPSPTLVFDNYLVHYGVNTAGKTESNTANWEYVGIVPGTTTGCENYVKLSALNSQTIKYWDYNESQYDFLAFSTGTKHAVSKTEFSGGSALTADEIGVTAMKYGTGLAGATAYTFYIPTVDALKNAFITDITKVRKADGNYGKEVTLKFKNLGSKVRMALYETVPGYSVKDVVFYTLDGTTNLTDAGKDGTARLIGDNNNSFPTKGTIEVYFPHIGSNNTSEEDYNKASATVTAASGTYDKYKEFGALTDQLVTKERDEVMTDVAVPEFLGRTLPEATFAGSANADFYESVFPISTSYPLTLRVDYTLVPIDGAAETITVKGARAVVPSTYTKWQPNYAYTYIFKITDNTNGWTGTSSDPSGLFPITFDAVVAEATDANAEQTTITTVSAPTITTYQQNHDPLKPENEYSIAKGTGVNGRNVYVQVMNNSTSPASLVDDLNDDTDDGTGRSLLYAVSKATATEAEVMDALENRTTAIDADDVTGRNGITLTLDDTNIVNTVDEIVNGVDDNPISVAPGEAAKIAIGSLSTGTYAYVYDYTEEGGGAKTETTIYQPIAAEVGDVIASGTKYITKAILDVIDYDTNKTADDEDVDPGYLYFSKTTNGGATTTYSFISVDGKKTLPAGLLKVPVGSLQTGDGVVTVIAGTIVFTTYVRNDGKYAVKVIKIVA